MNCVVFNHDGSIKNLYLQDIIVQGNNNVDDIYCAIEGYSNDAYTAGAIFTLPNLDHSAITGVTASFSVDGSAYQGFKITLTAQETAFAGILKMSLSLTGQSLERAFSVNVNLTINQSGYIPDYTNITMSQYENMIATLATLQPKYVLNNARFYTSVSSAEADLDNLAYYQIVIIADTDHPEENAKLYFKNGNGGLTYLNDLGNGIASISTTFVSSETSYEVYKIEATLTNDVVLDGGTFHVPHGVGIANVSLNSLNQFIVTLENGTTINTGAVNTRKLYRHLIPLITLNESETAYGYITVEVYDTKEGDYTDFDEFLSLHSGEVLMVGGGIPDSNGDEVAINSIQITKENNKYKIACTGGGTGPELLNGYLYFGLGFTQFSYDVSSMFMISTKGTILYISGYNLSASELAVIAEDPTTVLYSSTLGFAFYLKDKGGNSANGTLDYIGFHYYSGAEDELLVYKWTINKSTGVGTMLHTCLGRYVKDIGNTANPTMTYPEYIDSNVSPYNILIKTHGLYAYYDSTTTGTNQTNWIFKTAVYDSSNGNKFYYKVTLNVYNPYSISGTAEKVYLTCSYIHSLSFTISEFIKVGYDGARSYITLTTPYTVKLSLLSSDNTQITKMSDLFISSSKTLNPKYRDICCNNTTLPTASNSTESSSGRKYTSIIIDGIYNPNFYGTFITIPTFDSSVLAVACEVTDSVSITDTVTEYIGD